MQEEWNEEEEDDSIDRGTKMILDGSLYVSLYSENMLEVAY